jgi:hypothetical protein
MGGVDWIDLAQDSDRCQALVNTVMNCFIKSHELLDQLRNY